MIDSRIFLAWHGRFASTCIERNIQAVFVRWHCANDLRLDIIQKMIGSVELFSKTIL